MANFFYFSFMRGEIFLACSSLFMIHTRHPSGLDPSQARRTRQGASHTWAVVEVSAEIVSLWQMLRRSARHILRRGKTCPGKPSSALSSGSESASTKPRVAVIEDRYERRSTIITSQLSVEHWHETLADAILDRLIHRAYRLKLEGESMREQRAQLHESAPLRSL